MSVTPYNDFYPRPPRGGRLFPFSAGPAIFSYFYPRPPRGGRLNKGEITAEDYKFLSTPSARRATHGTITLSLTVGKFLSTPSARRATSQQKFNRRSMYISIHALREEGDDNDVDKFIASFDFYPRPPRGGRLPTVQRPGRVAPISIHALREEGDHKNLKMDGLQMDFYPRPPRGGRQAKTTTTRGANLFLSTPSARRATWDSMLGAIQDNIFLSTPSARRATRKRYGAVGTDSNFYPRPPRGGRRNGN